jgi:hypothetical protein
MGYGVVVLFVRGSSEVVRHEGVVGPHALHLLIPEVAEEEAFSWAI